MTIRSCPARSRRAAGARVVVSAALLAAGLPALANDRPFESARTAVAEDDDQVWSFEVWGRQIGRVRSLTVEPDYSFDPANSLQIELTRQIDRQGQDTGHEVELEYKHLFNRLARDGWGWGISAALGAERNAGGSARTLAMRLPLSVDLGQISGSADGSNSGSLLHLNLGLQKIGAARRQWTSAVAFEQPLPQRSLLFAELARDGASHLAQIGLRHWLRRDKLAIDLAWQQRRGDGERSAGWVAGIGWYDL